MTPGGEVVMCRWPIRLRAWWTEPAPRQGTWGNYYDPNGGFV